MRFRLLIIFSVILSFSSLCPAGTYTYNAEKNVIGSVKTHVTLENQSLIELAYELGLGFNEIAEANPDLDPFMPGKGISLHIPSAWILPEIKPHKGIVINLSEMRLFYFSPGRNSGGKVLTFPIGIGTEGKETPEGIFRIIEKRNRPVWNVPRSILEERPELPRVVPPGPDNPLGSHAMRLSEGTILIHGTNRPYAVGRKASHGCIRLYPNDIPELFKSVPVNTKVTIVRQPVKVGTVNGRVYMEVHSDPDIEINYFNEAVRLLIKEGLLPNIDKDKMISVLRQKRGYPVDITADRKEPEKV